ncbi:proteophosphoglycan related, partial [Cystoisospora suis]
MQACEQPDLEWLNSNSFPSVPPLQPLYGQQDGAGWADCIFYLDVAESTSFSPIFQTVPVHGVERGEGSGCDSSNSSMGARASSHVSTQSLTEKARSDTATRTAVRRGTGSLLGRFISSVLPASLNPSTPVDSSPRRRSFSPVVSEGSSSSLLSPDSPVCQWRAEVSPESQAPRHRLSRGASCGADFLSPCSPSPGPANGVLCRRFQVASRRNSGAARRPVRLDTYQEQLPKRALTLTFAFGSQSPRRPRRFEPHVDLSVSSSDVSVTSSSARGASSDESSRWKNQTARGALGSGQSCSRPPSGTQQSRLFQRDGGPYHATASDSSLGSSVQSPRYVSSSGCQPLRPSLAGTTGTKVPALDFFWLHSKTGSQSRRGEPEQPLNPEEKKAEVYKALFSSGRDETIRVATARLKQQQKGIVRQASESFSKQETLRSARAAERARRATVAATEHLTATPGVAVCQKPRLSLPDCLVSAPVRDALPFGGRLDSVGKYVGTIASERRERDLSKPRGKSGICFPDSCYQGGRSDDESSRRVVLVEHGPHGGVWHTAGMSDDECPSDECIEHFRRRVQSLGQHLQSFEGTLRRFRSASQPQLGKLFSAAGEDSLRGVRRLSSRCRSADDLFLTVRGAGPAGSRNDGAGSVNASISQSSRPVWGLLPKAFAHQASLQCRRQPYADSLSTCRPCPRSDALPARSPQIPAWKSSADYGKTGACKSIAEGESEGSSGVRSTEGEYWEPSRRRASRGGDDTAIAGIHETAEGAVSAAAVEEAEEGLTTPKQPTGVGENSRESGSGYQETFGLIDRRSTSETALGQKALRETATRAHPHQRVTPGEGGRDSDY